MNTTTPCQSLWNTSAQLMDARRSAVRSNLDEDTQTELGQYLTPSSIACFMASLFSERTIAEARLLDAGAGIGSLTAAFLDRWRGGGFQFDEVSVTAFEIDPSLTVLLDETIAGFATKLPIRTNIVRDDFINAAVGIIQSGGIGRFTHAILNPPYRKLSSASTHRSLLRKVGIESVNLYSAFVALSILLVEPGGEISVIIPRSFCNGPYYKPFRDLLLERGSIRHIHLFESRRKAFREDSVLQENVILLYAVGENPGPVTVSTSSDADFSDITSVVHPYDHIVVPGDPGRFIHIPTSKGHDALDTFRDIRYTLKDLGISVSTGPVVDFRLRSHLRMMPEVGTVPLLYPAHFSGGSLVWPKAELKKSNAIELNEETARWLFPSGTYAVTKRFSSKEEKRRLVASVVTPDPFGASRYLGFENHLNIFHINKNGLQDDLARGLVVYLNSTMVDMYFRRFSGHTQVNATDLRLLKYPSYDTLRAMGSWAKHLGKVTQHQIDEHIQGAIG